MKPTALFKSLLLGFIVFAIASPQLVQADAGYTYQQYREVVDLFYSVE